MAETKDKESVLSDTFNHLNGKIVREAEVTGLFRSLMDEMETRLTKEVQERRPALYAAWMQEPENTQGTGAALAQLPRFLSKKSLTRMKKYYKDSYPDFYPGHLGSYTPESYSEEKFIPPTPVQFVEAIHDWEAWVGDQHLYVDAGDYLAVQKHILPREQFNLMACALEAVDSATEKLEKGHLIPATWTGRAPAPQKAGQF